MPRDLNVLVKSCLARCADLRYLHKLQSFLLVLGHGQTQFYAFKLIRFCILSLSDLSYARRIFDSIHSPNSFLYATLLSAYSSSLPNPSPSLSLFVSMIRSNLRPSAFTLPPTFNACVDVLHFGFMRSVHSISFRYGILPNSCVVLASVVDAYSRFFDFESGRRLLDETVLSGEDNVAAWTALMSGYARKGLIGNALAVFERMPHRDLPAWNAAIASCAQNGMFVEAVGVFRRMVMDLQPNARTVASIIPACGHLGMLRLGKSLHGYVVKSEAFCGPFVSNALVDVYGKCGSLREARLVFDRESDRSLEAWNSLINGLALHGHCKAAIEAFKQMGFEGVKPDVVTFVGILNACTHGGLVEEGLGYFESMRKVYGVAPEIQHYGCVIDLLGKAGRFEDAMRIIKDMTMEPDEVVWGSFLNGCRVHRFTELAEFAIRKLLEIDPNNTGYSVMLANLYSEQGKWEEVRKVRKLLKESRGKKLPGCSWVEVDGEVQQFKSGDNIHPKAEEMCHLLQSLVEQVEA